MPPWTRPNRSHRARRPGPPPEFKVKKVEAMKVITANRLLNGDVVWLGENGAWVERITLAKIFEGKEAVAGGLALGAEAEKNQEVVGVYDMDVAVEDGIVAPVRLRERIRATGPTTHPQFGKQAQAVSA